MSNTNENNIVKTDAEIRAEHERVFNLLEEKGLTFQEIMKVRDAIENNAFLNDPNIEVERGFSIDKPFYKNKLIKGWSFSTESEASFAGAIIKYAPEISPERACKVLSIVNSLLGKETEYKF